MSARRGLASGGEGTELRISAAPQMIMHPCAPRVCVGGGAGCVGVCVCVRARVRVCVRASEKERDTEREADREGRRERGRGRHGGVRETYIEIPGTLVPST